jgi:predicted dehydrogenase
MSGKRLSRSCGKSEPLNIIVIGSGMYTCGRGTDGYGTILPALVEWSKKEAIGDIYLIGASHSGIEEARNKISGLSSLVGIKPAIKYFSVGYRCGTRKYRDIFSAIKRPACAIVSIPDNLHKKIASVAMSCGLHTFVVKPLVPTLDDLKELLIIQDKAGVYGAVDFHKRFDLANINIKESISDNTLGDILYILVEFSQRRSVPLKSFVKWINATNVFQYLGIHYVDMIYFLTGATPIRAMALAQKGWLYSKGIAAYDSIEGIIEWKMPGGRRFTSCILTNWVDPMSTSAVSDQKIKIIGTRGRFESDQKNRGMTIVTEDKGIEEPNPYFSYYYNNDRSVVYGGYGIDSVKNFLDDVCGIENGNLLIEDLDRSRPTFRQSLVPTAVLDGINDSLRNNGRWVNIKRI